ncbi:PREDICTED: binder of sperm protein homolog 2-like [Miniopterus natalensis]|uniref:binder of sperm protein homolog 2-like n=1 Tax=Miniopterus natalensis TaxID=291302 RepID=UPI0007A6C9EC|nr:PREDICTED: binder of sperm protein homolog 2-like [Miniopterus natalensis]
MEAMRKLVGWMSLALCMSGLKAELNVHLHPPAPDNINTPCIFPFMYGDVIHYSCTTVRSDYAWCSLDSKFQGRWRYCTGTDPPPCTFPFLFRRKLFHTCTWDGYILNRTWCALTKNYDRDGKWKQCSPYK